MLLLWPGFCTKTDLIQDGNATVPIGGMGDEDEEDSAAVALQDDVEDESAVRHRVLATMQELSAHFNFWGTRTRITGDALSIYESAWSIQGEDYDSFRGERPYSLLSLPSAPVTGMTLRRTTRRRAWLIFVADCGASS